MTIFLSNCDAPRGDVPEHDNVSAAATAIASADPLMDLYIEGRIIPACAAERLWRGRGTLVGVRALGIDYGERRIGLALSDATGLLASPWKKIENTANVGAAARRLADEVRALQADEGGLGTIVIGLPRRLNGEATEQTARVRKLAELLAAEVSVPVALQDERLTSREAEALLAERERDWRRRKDRVDALAAALILQDYLDHQPRS
jgi:putative Holliday junction resolvase